MERTYPYLAHNLKRLDMSPIVVPDEAYDMALDEEWANPYQVRRGGGGSAPEVIEDEPKPKNRGGRPRKVQA